MCQNIADVSETLPEVKIAVVFDHFFVVYVSRLEKPEVFCISQRRYGFIEALM